MAKKRADPTHGDGDVVDQVLRRVCGALADVLRPWATAALVAIGCVALLLTMIAAMLAVVIARA